jgi:hypothetical protein
MISSQGCFMQLKTCVMQVIQVHTQLYTYSGIVWIDFWPKNILNPLLYFLSSLFSSSYDINLFMINRCLVLTFYDVLSLIVTKSWNLTLLLTMICLIRQLLAFWLIFHILGDICSSDFSCSSCTYSVALSSCIVSIQLLSACISMLKYPIVGSSWLALAIRTLSCCWSWLVHKWSLLSSCTCSYGSVITCSLSISSLFPGGPNVLDGPGVHWWTKVLWWTGVL